MGTTALPVCWSSHCWPLKSTSWMLGGFSLVTVCSPCICFPLHGTRRGERYGESDVGISAAVTILPVTGSAHRIGSCPGSCPHQAVTKEAFPGPSLARCHCYYYFQIRGSHRSRACLYILHPAYPSLEPVPMPPRHGKSWFPGTTSREPPICYAVAELSPPLLCR